MTATATSRAERRKRETREALLDAALRVFLARGFDAATTREMAEVADVGAGTFYLHFQDKRHVFETLARRAARTIVGRWLAEVSPETTMADRVARALIVIAAYWREDPARARLLLEGGPAFGGEVHVRFANEMAAFFVDGNADGAPPPQVVSMFLIGLGIELGRVIVGGEPEESDAMVAGAVALAKRAFA